MTVKEFYDSIGGNYEDAKGRLITDERIKKFALRFPASTDYQEMIDAIAANDYETAFRASHTLKGVCLNLAFAKLAGSSSILCDQYRNGAPSQDVTPLLNEVKADYKALISALKGLE